MKTRKLALRLILLTALSAALLPRPSHACCEGGPGGHGHSRARGTRPAPPRGPEYRQYDLVVSEKAAPKWTRILRYADGQAGDASYRALIKSKSLVHDLNAELLASDDPRTAQFFREYGDIRDVDFDREFGRLTSVRADVAFDSRPYRLGAKLCYASTPSVSNVKHSVCFMQARDCTTKGLCVGARVYDRHYTLGYGEIAGRAHDRTQAGTVVQTFADDSVDVVFDGSERANGVLEVDLVSAKD